jgi:hypothetical protein
MTLSRMGCRFGVPSILVARDAQKRRKVEQCRKYRDRI